MSQNRFAFGFCTLTEAAIATTRPPGVLKGGVYDEIERIYANATLVDKATALYRRVP